MKVANLQQRKHDLDKKKGVELRTDITTQSRKSSTENIYEERYSSEEGTRTAQGRTESVKRHHSRSRSKSRQKSR